MNRFLTKMGMWVFLAAMLSVLGVRAEVAGRVGDAETCFKAYLENKTNETAVLYLRTAIRKNPNEIRYLKELAKTVANSGYEDDVVQEYRDLLFYSLDEATAVKTPEIIRLVADLRKNLIERQNHENGSKKVEALRSQLEKVQIPSDFNNVDVKTLETRISLLDELSLLVEDDEIEEGLNLARSIKTLVEARTSVAGLVGRIEKYLAPYGDRPVRDEVSLNRVFRELGSNPIVQPLSQVQDILMEVNAEDFSALPPNWRIMCERECVALSEKVENISLKISDAKVNILLKYIDDWAVPGTGGWTHTERLAKLEVKNRLLTKYIGESPEANALEKILEKQQAIMKEIRSERKIRLKEYQAKVIKRLDEVVEKLENLDGEMAGRCLRDEMAEINPEYLVPELQELYRDVYGRLMGKYDQWVEKENQYPAKARMLIEMTKIIKWKLEDL